MLRAKKQKMRFSPKMRCFVIKEYHCSLQLYTCIRVAFLEEFERPLSLGQNMMVLIDRIFNEEQLLFETFFPKMHIERDICRKLIISSHSTFTTI